MVKKTIAVLGDNENFSSNLMEVLTKQDLRLLFISEDEASKIELKQRLEEANPTAEVEFTSCEREGCWEADIIAITPMKSLSGELVQKIREVATQKIVLVFKKENNVSDHAELSNSLPYSKVIEIILNSPQKEFILSGKDENSIVAVKEIFENAGFKYKNNNDAGKNMV